MKLLIYLFILFAQLVHADTGSTLEKNQKLLEFLSQYKIEQWLDRETSMMSKRIPSQIPRHWDSDEFTNPLNHKEDDFIYVVHAVTFFDPKQVNSLKFGQKNRPVFASLVSSIDTDTFRISGFILKFSKDHIIGTSITDTMFDFKKFPTYMEASEEYANLFGVLTPEEMYLGSHWDKYITIFGLKQILGISTMVKNNEVALHGIDKNGKAVEISAVFYVGDGYAGGPGDDLIEFATKHKLPIIKLPKIEPVFGSNTYQ